MVKDGLMINSSAADHWRITQQRRPAPSTQTGSDANVIGRERRQASSANRMSTTRYIPHPKAARSVDQKLSQRRKYELLVAQSLPIQFSPVQSTAGKTATARVGNLGPLTRYEALRIERRECWQPFLVRSQIFFAIRAPVPPHVQSDACGGPLSISRRCRSSPSCSPTQR